MSNALHQTLAGKILRFIRLRDMKAGDHLTEASLQESLDVSRGPIRAAMLELTGLGALQKVKNKGFFIIDPQIELPHADGGVLDDERIYFSIADDRLAREIPDTVSESFMMARYSLSRQRLHRILARIASEGWIEQRDGRGWTFAMLVDSLESYRENYEMRQFLEPAAILGDHFKVNARKLDALAEQQHRIRDGGWDNLSQIDLFEFNANFHETIASMSGNRYVFDCVKRLNQLRRLVEYRQVLRREQVRIQNLEHLDILEMLKHSDLKDAASAMSLHLGNAKRSKAQASVFASKGICCII